MQGPQVCPHLKVSLASGGGGEGGVTSWDSRLLQPVSPAGYVRYSDLLVIITSRNKFEQLWGWERTLFTLRLWEYEYVLVKENFKQLEELRLHGEVNPNPRVQQSSLDFPWPHCSAVTQPCGCSSFVSKCVLRNAQHPRGTSKWLSHFCVTARGEHLRPGHRVQRKVNGKGQDAFLHHNVRKKRK